MIVLDNLNESIVANSGSASDPAVTCVATYYIESLNGLASANQYSEITDTPSATLVPPPSELSIRHIVKQITIHNNDDASHDVTVMWTDSSQFARLIVKTLTAGQFMYYESGLGWSVSS